MFKDFRGVSRLRKYGIFKDFHFFDGSVRAHGAQGPGGHGAQVPGGLGAQGPWGPVISAGALGPMGLRAQGPSGPVITTFYLVPFTLYLNSERHLKD